jgi:hypothetical protein
MNRKAAFLRTPVAIHFRIAVAVHLTSALVEYG